MFGKSQATESNMSGIAKERLNTIRNSRSKSEMISIVRVPENLTQYEALTFFINPSGKLLINEGQAKHMMKAQMDTLIVTDNSHVTWVGTVIQDDMTLSEVRLTQNREGEVTGYLMINDNQYRIRPLKEGGKHALYSIDYSEMFKARKEFMEERQQKK